MEYNLSILLIKVATKWNWEGRALLDVLAAVVYWTPFFLKVESLFALRLLAHADSALIRYGQFENVSQYWRSLTVLRIKLEGDDSLSVDNICATVSDFSHDDATN